ncbi:MAG: hypothetical protein PUP91_32920 [Rhizonema sp. PD37]|nr:hypothetical protein [Rhizonema sp. PD37]
MYHHYTEADFKFESSAKKCIVENVDELSIAQAELSAYIEAQAQAIAPEIEIDSVIDIDFGTLYRVWEGHRLQGTYYHALDGKWVVQSNYNSNRPRCNTQSEAELLVIAMSGLLVADTAPELRDIEKLLDKPFDELTPLEWEYLKQQALLAA